MNKDQIKEQIQLLKDKQIASDEVVTFMLKAIKENPDGFEQALTELKDRPRSGGKTHNP